MKEQARERDGDPMWKQCPVLLYFLFEYRVLIVIWLAVSFGCIITLAFLYQQLSDWSPLIRLAQIQAILHAGAQRLFAKCKSDPVMHRSHWFVKLQVSSHCRAQPAKTTEPSQSFPHSHGPPPCPFSSSNCSSHSWIHGASQSHRSFAFALSWLQKSLHTSS